jgi:hypothetical protein
MYNPYSPTIQIRPILRLASPKSTPFIGNNLLYIDVILINFSAIY